MSESDQAPDSLEFPSSLRLATEVLLALGYASRFTNTRKRVGRSTVMRARAGDMNRRGRD
jgi:hypothetical protein